MEKKSKKIWIIGGLALLLLGVTVSISLAFFSDSGSQDFNNFLQSECLNIVYEDNTDAIALTNTYPIADEEGYETEAYTFTFTNTCENLITYKINLETLNTSTLDEQYLDVILDLNEVKRLTEYEAGSITLANARSSYILEEGILGGGESVTRSLRMWLDYDTTVEQGANKSMQNKIVITAEPEVYTCENAGISNFKDCILATEFRETDVNRAIEQIEAKGEPDFSRTSPYIIYKEVEATTVTSRANVTDTTAYVGTGYIFDDVAGFFELVSPELKYYTDIDLNDGNTYYTCGVTKYNDGTYSKESRCIRPFKITNVYNENGNYIIDGIMLSQEVEKSSFSDSGLYAAEDDYGTSYYFRGMINNNYVNFAGSLWRIIRINGDGSIRLISENFIGSTTLFNENMSSPVYAGYMYGDINGTTLEEINANIHDSIAKTIVDNWYEENILNTEYEDYLADNLFCNDRSIYTGDGISTTASTYYSAFNRLYSNKEPTLKCLEKNDAFTVNDITYGNGALTYPVGLITADEIAMAGNVMGYLNQLDYLLSHSSYYTMTPYVFLNNVISFLEKYSNGGLVGSYRNGATIVPVINLKPDIIITGGIGTAGDPYIISMN